MRLSRGVLESFVSIQLCFRHLKRLRLPIKHTGLSEGKRQLPQERFHRPRFDTI